MKDSMKHFFTRIREKALDARQPPVQIIAFGDSVTQGVMEHLILDSNVVYHRLLQQHLERFYPTTTFNTINAGVSGDWAKAALDRLERDVIRHQPDLVLVAFGLNDACTGTEDEFKAALNQIVTEVRRQTQADILLLTPSFIATRSTPRIHPDHVNFVETLIRTQIDGKLDRYAEIIRSVAKTNKVLLADVHREWTRLSQTGVDTNLWLINGLNHPDARGHHLAATVVFHTLLTQRP
jgi:lysophospholipase L1-like esterase